MCEQCFLNPLGFGKVLPTLYLGRARRNGWEGKQRDWFLVVCNDPDVYWQETPRLESSFSSLKEYDKSVERFKEQFYNNHLDVMFVHRMIQSAIEKKLYHEKEDGNFIYWLYDLLAKHIDKTEPESEDDDGVMSEWEKQNPSDLTISKY